MSDGTTTCWTVVRGAADGRDDDRRQFADRYVPVIRAYLGARWRASPNMQDLDDAVQEVFVETLREGGALARVDAGRPGGFRAFLYGVVRNVAARHESKRIRSRENRLATGFEPAGRDEQQLSRMFDRSWARALMREAAALQERLAGDDARARSRVELLRLRFHENLPIREIARLRGDDAAEVHREYARARRDFQRALEQTIAFHGPGAEIDEECARLLEMLQ